VFPSISREQIADLEIPLPPLEEQRRIVAEIEGYQQVIDGARQILAAYNPHIEVQSDWPRVPLGSVFKLTSGKFLPGKAREDGEHPVYGGNGIMGYHNDSFISTETLVIGRVGAYCGAVHLTRPNAWITDNALYVLEWLQKVDPRFIAYAVRDANLNQYAKQGGQPYISQSIVAAVQIPLPSLAEQERIVAELDAEAARLEAVRGLIPAFEAKIQRTLARVWGSNEDLANGVKTTTT
jgi:restriction endonuclease S subunit